MQTNGVILKAKEWLYILVMIVTLFALPAQAEVAPTLELRAAIPYSKVTGPDSVQVNYPHPLGVAPNTSYEAPPFGFIRRGNSVYFGAGCREYDLLSNTLKCDLPKNLNGKYISYDGEVFWGCLDEKKDRSDGSVLFYRNDGSSSSPPRACYEKIIHPSSSYSADGEGIPHKSYISLHFRNINTGKFVAISLKGEKSVTDFYGYTGNGRYVIADGNWIDLKLRKPTNIYFGSVANYDATILATRESLITVIDGENVQKSSLSALRINASGKRSYLWRHQPFGDALAFSWNSKYLLTGGAETKLIEVATGKVILDNLKGDRGAKFSPDGMTFVTTDEVGFYIYSLPKGSPPLFGKYPGPSYVPKF